MILNRIEESHISNAVSNTPSYRSSRVVTTFKRLGTRRRSSKNLSFMNNSIRTLRTIDERKKGGRSEALRKLKDAMFKPINKNNGVREYATEARARDLLGKFQDGNIEAQRFDWNFLMRANNVLKMIEDKDIKGYSG